MTNERKIAIQEIALKNLYEYYILGNVRANYFDGMLDKEAYENFSKKFFSSFKEDVSEEDIEDFHYIKQLLPDATNNELFQILKLNSFEMLRRII